MITLNNCTENDARDTLESIDSDAYLFHNAKFDLSVARRGFGLTPPSHDPLLLAFLVNPHNSSDNLVKAIKKLEERNDNNTGFRGASNSTLS
jgi:hypothetical protein